MIKAFLGASLPLLLVFALTGSAAAQVCVAPPSGLVSWWPGDGNASDIQDGNHGTLQNGATFAAGKVGQAFSFDGVDDSVDVADNSNLNPGMGSFTVDAWVFKSRLQSDFAVAPVIAKHVGDFRNGYYLGAGSHGETGIPNNEIEAVVGDGDGNRVEFGTGVHVPLNVWFHLAMSYDNSTKTLRVYRDGALISSGSNLFIGSVNPSGQIFRIGSYNRTTLGRIETFPGVIDEVEFFNRALSASEIQAIFNAGSAGKCKGAIEVAIDIKPGSFPNSLNPRSKGVIPVAILTTDSFDATTVDPTTVLFGPTGTEAASVHSALEDVDGDGNTDMILHFNTQATRMQCEDTSATLTGETFDGQAIEGSDSINTVGCKLSNREDR